ncbi:hypothetical protein [Opitutus sp. ER46]|uniref:hypothetical protein n=1 Tax=Opitutus sp. ER46 TaxID=2161864 RepID=UPI000D317127|nr:hypothetical protein [Opitutus sp. ER46]PTX98432.1 hypothetical protein DB354_03955 [Opitutus sp. ER46]
MAGELPSHVVSAISFVGRSGGAIKLLGGFRKPQHSVPDAANAATNAFLARICAGELGEQAEQLFQDVRAALAYKRKDVSLSVTSPVATLAAKDFAVELAYAVDEANPAHYRVTTTLRDLHDVDLARSEPFARVFAGRFSEIEFMFAKAARVEAVIDAIEALDGENGIAVDYPSDYRDCTIRVEGVDAQVRCSGVALEVIFPRGGAPAELIDAFATVRDAFQISKVLSGLIGG